jgi:hypothetical protein
MYVNWFYLPGEKADPNMFLKGKNGAIGKEGLALHPAEIE